MVEILFRKYKNAWVAETAFLSSYDAAALNSNHLKIVELGESVGPYLLSDMKRNGTPWFIALSKIYNVNPIQTKNRGRHGEMIKDWLQWYKLNKSAWW